MIHAYTDGACTKNPGGTGGWSFFFKDISTNSILAESSGYVESTTSNRMEILAVALAIITAPKLHINSFHIFSDSQYVINTLTKGWRRKANTDLWAVIDHSARHLDITYHWIKGHSNHPENTYADQLAQTASKLRISSTSLQHL